MTSKPAPLINFLKMVEDVRREASCSHAFTDILVIGIFAQLVPSPGKIWRTLVATSRSGSRRFWIYLAAYLLTTPFTELSACFALKNFKRASQTG